jgi:hypothetical protein
MPTRTLAGELVTTTGVPVRDMNVTLRETGESQVTDNLGAFSFETPFSVNSFTLEIGNDEEKGSVAVDVLENDSPAISVSLVLNEESKRITASNVQIWGRIIGECDQYFENRPVIRQSVGVSGSVTCTLRFFVSGDGKRLERVSSELQVRSCDVRKWRPIISGSTGFGLNAGFGDIEFPFIDDREHCEYRLIVPTGKRGKLLAIYLHTFTLQSLEED